MQARQQMQMATVPKQRRWKQATQQPRRPAYVARTNDPQVREGQLEMRQDETLGPLYIRKAQRLRVVDAADGEGDET